jgi:hypothetical protein
LEFTVFGSGLQQYVVPQVKELLLPFGALKAFNLVMDKNTGNSKVGSGCHTSGFSAQALVWQLSHLSPKMHGASFHCSVMMRSERLRTCVHDREEDRMIAT